MLFALLILHLMAALQCSSAKAEVYHYGQDLTVIGEVGTYTIRDGDESLIELARKFGIGFNEIADANPALDPFVPGAGSLVTIPRSWVLPAVARYEGIVINLAEMRLYYFFKQHRSPSVMTFPIGIGTEGNDTPLGVFRVTEKTVHPSWYVPSSILRERPDLPNVVPPGPDNPLGTHALRLSLGSVLIHGTNRPFGVGRRVSHGCIRLYPEDIPKLFDAVSLGTTVTIVHQPVKIGVRDNRLFIEVHRSESDVRNLNYYDEAVRILEKKNFFGHAISKEKLEQALREKTGIPVDISP
ncbi:MAG: L,D-transpeptidase family protein [Nitrospirota bacterium]